MPTLTEVFGISTLVPKSYIEREGVDNTFKTIIEHRDCHVAIYGSSKQGKTVLRRRLIPLEGSIDVHCSPTKSIEQIYADIAEACGAHIEYDDLLDTSRGVLRARIGDRCFNVFEAQSLASLLSATKNRRIICIENLHYLSKDLQRRLAFDLKTFHEFGVRFLLIGTWRNAEYLQLMNPDLSSRIFVIPVEPWSTDALEQIAAKGSHALNITIPSDIVGSFSQLAYGNVGLFQAYLHEFCALQDVFETQLANKTLQSNLAFDQTVASLVHSFKAQLQSALSIFASGNLLESSSLVLPYYVAIVMARASVEDLENGLTLVQLRDRVRDIHHEPDKIRDKDMSFFMGRLPKYQENCPLFHYDALNNRLYFLDRRYLLAIGQGHGMDIASEIAAPADLP